MDLLLHSFLLVARHGGISHAARELGITQPALSRRIQALESELGARLFERTPRGMVPNALGRIVESEGRAIVERYDRLRETIRAHVRLEAGVVRVGGGATAVSVLLPPAIARFQGRHPGVRFQVREAGSRQVEADVLAERIDLGIVTLPTHSTDLETTSLGSDEIVVVASSGHRLARLAEVPVARLAGENAVGFEAESAIRRLVDGALQAAGVEMNVVMELLSIPAILQMVRTTDTLGFVSELGVDRADPRIRILPVVGLKIRRRLAVIRKRGRPLPPAAAAFSAVLKARALPGNPTDPPPSLAGSPS